MHTLDAFAQDKLDELQRRGLSRALAETVREDGIWVERGGRRLLSFSCNDYLNLSQHPAVKQAAKAASIQTEEILEMVLVGNSTMHHLLLNLHPKDLGLAPFVPAIHSLHPL